MEYIHQEQPRKSLSKYVSEQNIFKKKAAEKNETHVSRQIHFLLSYILQDNESNGISILSSQNLRTAGLIVVTFYTGRPCTFVKKPCLSVCLSIRLRSSVSARTVTQIFFTI
jgi:hypothetical protein